MIIFHANRRERAENFFPRRFFLLVSLKTKTFLLFLRASDSRLLKIHEQRILNWNFFDFKSHRSLQLEHIYSTKMQHILKLRNFSEQTELQSSQITCSCLPNRDLLSLNVFLIALLNRVARDVFVNNISCKYLATEPL